MEYDKELATRLLTETMRELPGYLVITSDSSLV